MLKNVLPCLDRTLINQIDILSFCLLLEVSNFYNNDLVFDDDYKKKETKEQMKHVRVGHTGLYLLFQCKTQEID